MKATSPNTPQTAPAAAWGDEATQLAEWTKRILRNRLDAYVRYLPLDQRKNGDVTTIKDTPTKIRMMRHFKGAEVSDLMVLHATSADEMSRWICIDIDQKEEHPSDPTIRERNRKAAIWYHDHLTKMGFGPMLENSNGNGGYHVWAILCSPIPMATAHAFGKMLASKYAEAGLLKKPEVFPKAPAINPPDKFGTGVRIPGRHHTRDHYSTIWNGNEFVGGAAAIQILLAINGDDTSLVTSQCDTEDKDKDNTIQGSRDTGVQGFRDSEIQDSNAGMVCIPISLHPCTPVSILPSLIPQQQGERHRLIMRYARYLKFECKLAGADEKTLRPHFDAWWVLALSKVGTTDEDFNWNEFLEAFEKCKKPLANDPVTVAAGKIDMNKLPACANQYEAREKHIRQVLALCWELSREKPDEPFHLSANKIHLVLNMQATTAWTCMKRLAKVKIVECVTLGQAKPGGRATIWKWIWKAIAVVNEDANKIQGKE